MLASASLALSNFSSPAVGRLLPARVSMSKRADSSVEALRSADLPNLTKIVEVDSATWCLRLTSEFEFEVQVGVRLDSLNDSEVDDNPVAALVDCPIDLDVRSGFVAVEKRDENRLDLHPEHRKIEDRSDVIFVLQPISEGRGTAERIRLDLR